MNIEFVSYTGKWPNLCHGVLTLNIDGNEVKFGHETNSYDWKEGKYRDNNYDDFWYSGGSCGFSDNYSESTVTKDAWKIYENDLPDIYKSYAKEFIKVLNDNLPYGCCGGCL